MFPRQIDFLHTKTTETTLKRKCSTTLVDLLVLISAMFKLDTYVHELMLLAHISHSYHCQTRALAANIWDQMQQILESEKSC